MASRRCRVCLIAVASLTPCSISDKTQSHLYSQEQLRKHYYRNQMKGINGQAFAPEKVEVSFIYDFMDQAKTACPRFKRYGCPKNA